MASGIGLVTRGWICPKRNVTRIVKYGLPLNLSFEEQQQLALFLKNLDYWTLNLILTQYLNLNIEEKTYNLEIKDPTKLNLQIKCEA